MKVIILYHDESFREVEVADGLTPSQAIEQAKLELKADSFSKDYLEGIKSFEVEEDFV